MRIRRQTYNFNQRTPKFIYLCFIMNLGKQKLPLQIILSYLAISLLAIGVAFFLFSKFKVLAQINEQENTLKLIEAGELINEVYEIDSYSRIALLTNSNKDYDRYTAKIDSLFFYVDEVKNFTFTNEQQEQLEHIKTLINAKKSTIEQLLLLKTTYSHTTSLDDILEEFRLLENSMGRLTLENFVRDPHKLSPEEKANYLAYIDFLNTISEPDEHISTEIVQSSLEASKYIVTEAKKQDSKARKHLEQKESELIQTELDLSKQLRELLAAFDTETKKYIEEDKLQKEEMYSKTLRTLLLAGVIGFIFLLVFSYLILSNFFKAERFKKNLQIAKQYSDALVKSREQLLSTVSHDLKNPLQSLLGFSQLLEKTDLNSRQAHYVNQLHSSAGFANKLVEDLLDFSKLDAGSIQLNYTPFSLTDLLSRLVYSNQEIYATEEVCLELNIPFELENKWFYSDPIRLQQVFNNILSNAFKFTERGYVKVEVDLIEKHESSYKLEIKVSDTGIGISEDKIHTIFDEFIQAGTTQHNKHSGSGLGLTISKKIVELLGGELRLESELGKGSIFTCTLDLEISKLEISKTQQKTKKIQPQHAVIIDDDQSILELMKEFLKHLNCKPYCFSSFTEAKEKLAKDFSYDILITDIQMPEIDGFEIVRKLKQEGALNYTGQEVFAITGNTEYATRHYKDQGFSGVLTKPFNIKRFMEVMQVHYPNWEIKEMKSKQENDPTTNKLFSLVQLKAFLPDEESLLEILKVFETETLKNMTEMNSAIEANDKDQIRHWAHKIKTMAKQIEAKELLDTLYFLDSTKIDKCSNTKLKKAYKSLDLGFSKLFKHMKQEGLL